MNNNLITSPLFKRLATALLMVFAAQTVQAATYYVATTGNDANSGASAAPWKTIQKAAGVVNPGDTVIVRPGTYSGPITTSRGGTATARVRFVSENLWGAKIQTAGAQYIWINNSSANYLDIDGFEVTGDARGGIFNYASHVRVTRNHVHHLGHKTICDPRVAWGQTDAGAAIDHVGAPTTPRSATDNDTIGNWVHDINVHCVAPAGTAGSHGIYHAYGSGVIANNLVYRSQSYGIHVWHNPRDVKVVHNTVFRNAHGIVVGGQDAVAENIYVANNIFYHNTGVGARVMGQIGPSPSIQFVNNIIFRNATPIMISAGLSPSFSGTLEADPLFVNYVETGGGDYRLSPGSPGIGKAVALSLDQIKVDYPGNVRPQGLPDIGAYEYGASTPPPAFNFSLANGGNKTVTRGGSVTNTLAATLVSGTAQAVSLSVSGLPSGVTRSFSATSCTPNCSSTLTLSASTAAALGTASLTVTAAGGGISRTSSFTLTVNALQTSTHSVTLSAAQAAPGAALTATVNGGSGSATQWVAVYLATAPDSAYSYKGNWKYLNGAQTAPTTAVPTPVQLTFAAPMDAGVYNLRFFANTGSGTRLALSPNLTVGSTTDLNGDGITNVTDIQIAVNQAAGGAACGSGDVNRDGVCNVADVQLVVNRSLGL